jgi:hypothetical protein
MPDIPMNLPLNLVIDRTADGKLRVQVVGLPESAVEATDVTGPLDAVQDTLLRFLDARPREFKQSGQEGATAHGVPPVEDVEVALTDEEDKDLRRADDFRRPSEADRPLPIASPGISRGVLSPFRPVTVNTEGRIFLGSGEQLPIPGLEPEKVRQSIADLDEGRSHRIVAETRDEFLAELDVLCEAKGQLPD